MKKCLVFFLSIVIYFSLGVPDSQAGTNTVLKLVINNPYMSVLKGDSASGTYRKLIRAAVRRR